MNKDISSILNHTSKKLFKKKGFSLFKLIEVWSELFPELDQDSFPMKLQKGLLVVEVYNDALMFELQYAKQEMIDKVNNFFNDKLVKELKFKIVAKGVVGDLSQKKIIKKSERETLSDQLKEEISNIDDPSIKLILEKIAKKAFK